MDATTPVAKKVRSKALSEAQKRYYERTRDSRLEQMRTRAKERNELIKQACNNDAQLAEERKRQFMEKYYTYVRNKTNATMKEWYDDPTITEEFKTFLRKCVEPNKGVCSRRFFNELRKCVTRVADIPVNTLVTTVVDGQGEYGGALTNTAEFYANSQQT